MSSQIARNNNLGRTLLVDSSVFCHRGGPMIVLHPARALFPVIHQGKPPYFFSTPPLSQTLKAHGCWQTFKKSQPLHCEPFFRHTLFIPLCVTSFVLCESIFRWLFSVVSSHLTIKILFQTYSYLNDAICHKLLFVVNFILVSKDY